MSQEIIEGIKVLSDMIKKCQEELKVILTDTETPLAERWEIYKQTVEEDIISEVDNYGPSLRILDKMGIDSPYDYLYCDRYATKDYLDIVDTLRDKIATEPNKRGSLWKSVDLTRENINKVKEEILSKFPERGFTYDW